MYGLRNSELSTCLFQFSHKTRQTKQCCCTLILLPKSTLNANLTTTNRFFTNDDWQRGRFENFESDHQHESNLESDVRFEIESNHEASQVPNVHVTFMNNLLWNSRLLWNELTSWCRKKQCCTIMILQIQKSVIDINILIYAKNWHDFLIEICHQNTSNL